MSNEHSEAGVKPGTVYEAGCLADCDDCGKEIDGMGEPLFACTDCPMSVCGECFDGEDGDPCPCCGEAEGS
jgi:hypothetical protein